MLKSHTCMQAMMEAAEREYKDVVTPVDSIPYMYTRSTLQLAVRKTPCCVSNSSLLHYSNQRQHKSLCGKQLPMPACAASIKGLEQPTRSGFIWCMQRMLSCGMWTLLRLNSTALIS